MAGINIGTLYAVLGIDEKGFTKGLDEAHKKMADLGKRLTSIGGKMSLGITAPIAGIGAAALDSAVKTGELAEQITNMSESTGLSTGRLQELKVVAENAGLSFEGVANASSMVQRKLMGVEDDSGKAAEVFKRLGINVHDSSGALKSMDVLFPELIKKFQSMTNVTERNMLAAQVFGRGVGEIAPILGMTSAEFEKASARARELGLVMDEAGLKKAAAFDDAIDDLKQTFAGAMRQIGTGFIPVLKDTLIPALVKLVGLVSTLFGWFGKLPTGMQATLAVFLGLAAVAGPVIMFIGSVITGWTAISTIAPVVATAATAAWTAITGPVGIVIAAIALVAGAVYLIIKNWDKVKAFFIKLWEGIKTVFVATFNFLKGLFLKYHPAGILISHWRPILKFFTDLWQRVYDITVGKLTGLFKWIGDKLKAVGGFFKGLYDSVVGHSYVPDLVNGIERNMKRLGGSALVEPVQQATDRASRSFASMSAPGPATAGPTSSGGGLERLISIQTEALRELRAMQRTRVTS